MVEFNRSRSKVPKDAEVNSKKKIGIIICDRYRRCAGGKCFRAMRNKEGAFSIYKYTEIELVGFTTCDGCPGGNIEYTGEEMVKNGAEVIHLATGLRKGVKSTFDFFSFSKIKPALPHEEKYHKISLTG